MTGKNNFDFPARRGGRRTSRQSIGLPTQPTAPRLAASASILLLVLAVSGCQVLTYVGPDGERFSRHCLGTTTALGLLMVETGTNGLRRVELRGYQSDSTQAMGAVTEAAVRAAIGAAK